MHYIEFMTKMNSCEVQYQYQISMFWHQLKPTQSDHVVLYAIFPIT